MNHLTSNLPPALLLDLDDTILTDNGVSQKTWLKACDLYAPLAGGHSSAEIYEAIHTVARGYWSDPENHRTGRLNLQAARRYVVNQAFSNLGIHNPQVADQLADTFTEEKEKAITPFPGAIEALISFKKRGLRMALLTNGASDTQRRKIDRFELKKFFDCIFIEAEFGVGKPDERVFQAALHNLNVSPSEAWMVGDDLNRDIAGAQKVGVFGIWVDGAGRGLPQPAAVQPDRIIRSLSQLAF